MHNAVRGYCMLSM